MDNLNLPKTDAEDELNQSFRINENDLENENEIEREQNESPMVNYLNIAQITIQISFKEFRKLIEPKLVKLQFKLFSCDMIENNPSHLF